MSGAATVGTALLGVGAAAAGFIFGLLYFAALDRTVRLLVTRRGGVAIWALSLGRIGAAVIAMGLAVRFGALCLLGLLIGFLAARATALHQRRKTS